MVGSRPPLGWDTKLLYGLGAAATGIKTRSFASFLMIFYNQGLGLSAALVSSAIAIATMLDSFFDPLVGQTSDNWRSKWGRRHPFMYVGILPTTVAFFFIWSPPPGLDGIHLFYFLLTCLVTVRLFDTFFELPSVALSAELTDKYNERTLLLSLRKGFEMVAGLLIMIAGLQYFMKEDADGGGGIIARDGYFAYGATASALILIVMVFSALGTHNQIKYLKQPPARRITPFVMLKEMFGSLNNKAFLVIALVGLFYSVCLGIRQGMETYFFIFFWQFSQAQIATLALVNVPGSLIGVALAPFVAHKLGKKWGTVVCWLPAMIVNLTPPVLKVMGLMPDDQNLTFWIIFAENFTTQVFLITASVLVPAMLADCVEESEVKTGRRAEGLLFAADNLSRTFVSGIGVLVTGVMLTVIAFPTDAERGEVPTSVLFNMVGVYTPTVAAFFLAAMALVLFFPITRHRHEENVRKLKDAAVAAQ
jgi:GPH family glycoside/pentoside/hexuronide:cation symporter